MNKRDNHDQILQALVSLTVKMDSIKEDIDEIKYEIKSMEPRISSLESKQAFATGFMAVLSIIIPPVVWVIYNKFFK